MFIEENRSDIQLRMNTKSSQIYKGGIFLLLLLGIVFLQLVTASLSIGHLPSKVINAHISLEVDEDVTLNGPVTVSDGSTLEYINKTIYYDSSEAPIFSVYGTLKLINCKIVPLKGAVDFISANQATVFLENVTFLNPSGRNSSLFSISDSYLYVNHAVFSGFHDGSIFSSSDVYISNMYLNITDHFTFYDDMNLTIANSIINLVENSPARLLEISSTDGASLINNTIRMPVEAVETYDAWLEGISLQSSTNVIVEGNTVINGGKTLVSYGSSNILIINNTFMNEKLVEGTELQIDSSSEDIIIANNSFSGFWEAIEIYAYKNVTVTGNVIVQSEAAIKVEPSTASKLTEVYVFKNTFVNSNVLIFSCNGLIVENNTIENSDVVIYNSNNVTLKQNLLRNVTVEVTESNDVTIANNTIYVLEGTEWLSVRNSTVTEYDNKIITLPNLGGEQNGGANKPEETLMLQDNQMLLITGIIVLLGLIVVIAMRRKRKAK